MGANDSKRKPPSEMSKTVPPSSCSSCRKANSFGTVLVFSRRSRVTFLRVMSFRRLVYFRNALQRRGGGRLSTLGGVGGGEAGPPRPPLVLLIFPPGEENRRKSISRNGVFFRSATAVPSTCAVTPLHT